MQKNNSKSFLDEITIFEVTPFNFSENKLKIRKKRFLKGDITFIRNRKCIFTLVLLFILLLIIIISIINIIRFKSNKTLQKNVEEKFFFFEKNQSKLNYCNNYGLMIYDYYYKGKFRLPNIGDYIQSLAALQFLPKNCKPYLVDRDSLKFYSGPKIKLILNGWHYLHSGNRYISEQIDPIFISYHLISKIKLPQVYIDTLEKNAPIGCRDYITRDQFNEYGIDSYFSSCLSTTLDIDYAVKDDERTNEIIFINYKLGKFVEADNYLYSLKAYDLAEKNITYINHTFNSEMSHLERFKLAKSLLNKYARAKLVISTRIHGALPCLALNTPVIFIQKNYNYNRFSGLYEFLNTIGINKDNKFEIRVNLDNKGFVYNSKKYLEYSNKLKEQLRNISNTFKL